MSATEEAIKTHSFWQSRTGCLIVNLVLVAAIIASAIWLPPISLGKRLAEGEYVILGEEAWGITDPDGTQFAVPPDKLRGQLKARLVSVPRAEFLEGSAGEDLLPAVEAQPSYMDIKSPFYRISLRGEPPEAAVLTVPIPNDAQPYETLDMYMWSDDTWTWIPAQVIPEEDVIIAELDHIPARFGFVVAQTRILPPVVSAYTTDPGAIPQEASGTVGEVNPRLLTLNGSGEVIGAAPITLGDNSLAIIPVLSNVNADGTIRNDLVDNMLVDPARRQAHINAIVRAVTENNYQGVEVDYRAVDLGLRREFTDFVATLADRLHEQGKVLSVRVEFPRQIAYDRWDTGVFDWRELGQHVDSLKVPGFTDPQAYVPGDRMDQLLRWAVSQVNRHRLQFILSTRSVDLRGNNPTYLPYAQALAPFSQVAVEGERKAVKPGERVAFDLSAGKGSTGMMYDEGCHTYWFRYRDERNQEHTVWLENAASIAHKLRILARYNLRGVAFEYLLDDGNDGEVWKVIHEFHTLTVPDMTDRFAVVWRVVNERGQEVENLQTSLADPRLVWVAPREHGTYKVIAAISSDGGKTATASGETTVQVGGELASPTPTPTPRGSEEKATPTPAPTNTPAPTPTPQPTPTQAVAQARAEAEAVVTSNVLNLRAGPGTNYARVGQVRKGTRLKVVGKNSQGTWIKVVAPNGTEAWVILTYVKLTTSLNALPQVKAPPTPTPAPRPTRPPSGGPAPAPRATGFGYGVQAHAFNDLDKVVHAIKDLGFGWLKQQVRWEYVEGRKGQYGWAGLDRIADACNAAGIKVMFSVVAAPGWARGGKGGVGPPDNYQDFYNFMGAMAAHFKGRVHAYEIWNEQNLQREWEGAPLSAADYVRLLKGAYRAIKAADPNAIVVSGAPTPTGINDGVWAIDDRTYLQQMYNAGLKYYCDAVGAHPSGYANPPDVYYRGGDFDPNRGYDDHPSFFFRNTMEDYYRIMAANGDGGKRIWATEFGWPTVDGMGVPPSPGYEFAADINEQQQADYIVRAYTWARNWGHAGVMFLWNLNFWPTTGPENEMAKYGIVRGDWSPRPAYIALKNMPK